MDSNEALTQFTPEQEKIPPDYQWFNSTLQQRAKNEWQSAQDAWSLGFKERAGMHVGNALLYWASDQFLARVGNSHHLKLTALHYDMLNPLLLNEDWLLQSGIYTFKNLDNVSNGAQFQQVDVNSVNQNYSRELYAATQILQQFVHPENILLLSIYHPEEFGWQYKSPTHPNLFVKVGQHYYNFGMWES